MCFIVTLKIAGIVYVKLIILAKGLISFQVKVYKTEMFVRIFLN